MAVIMASSAGPAAAISDARALRCLVESLTVVLQFCDTIVDLRSNETITFEIIATEYLTNSKARSKTAQISSQRFLSFSRCLALPLSRGLLPVR